MEVVEGKAGGGLGEQWARPEACHRALGPHVWTPPQSTQTLSTPCPCKLVSLLLLLSPDGGIGWFSGPQDRRGGEMPTCPQPAWKHLDRKFQGPEGGTQAPSVCIPLAWRTPQPLGRSVAREGPEQSPLGVELRGVASLAWFRGRDCTRLVDRHIRTSCLLPGACPQAPRMFFFEALEDRRFCFPFHFCFL